MPIILVDAAFSEIDADRIVNVKSSYLLAV